MRTASARLAWSSTVLCAVLASPALASFHLMQIEQVIGGVNGDTNLQAIQLRMRSGGQNLVSNARLVAWDATGNNPVVIMDMESDVPFSAAGSRVLIASSAFDSAFTPDADFTMTNLVPASYLTAGKLTFETDGGSVYWSLAWGGAGYTATSTSLTADNDADKNFNPPFADSLPTSNTQALRFTGVAAALSTNNAADYALTTGSAVFTNNAGTSGSALPTATPTVTPSHTPTPTPTTTPTTTPTPSITLTPSTTPTPSDTPTPSLTPTITPSLTPGGIILDVDGNGVVEALMDGLLVLRYLFGFRGPTLIFEAAADGAPRDTAEEIEAFIATILGPLDVDGNGSVQPLRDGLLILRYLFGFRDDALISGAIGSDATRTTAPAIESYIEMLL